MKGVVIMFIVEKSVLPRMGWPLDMAMEMTRDSQVYNDAFELVALERP